MSKFLKTLEKQRGKILAKSRERRLCANGCGHEVSLADAIRGRNNLVTVNVDGHAKPAHRECPE